MDHHHNVFWPLVSLFATAISIPVALFLDKRLAARLPHTRPYKWGFYLGCMNIIVCAPLALLLFGIAGFGKTSDALLAGVVGGAWFLFHAVCGFYIIKRRRWAWVLGTVLSFNVLEWVINGIYVRNRWQEMKPDRVGML